MIKPVVKDLWAVDLCDTTQSRVVDIEIWRLWQPPDPEDVLVWFTVDIGTADSDAADQFQVAVATPKGIKARRNKSKFRGIVIREWDPELAEAAIGEYVGRIECNSWIAVVEELQKDFLWEYAR